MFQIYGRKNRKPFTPNDLDNIRDTIINKTDCNWKYIERYITCMGYPKNNIHFIFNNMNRFNKYRDLVFNIIHSNNLPDTPQMANFILYKLCELNYDPNLKFVPFTGLTNKTKKYDIMWLLACKNLRYQFIVTDFMRSFNFTYRDKYI